MKLEYFVVKKMNHDTGVVMLLQGVINGLYSK